MTMFVLAGLTVIALAVAWGTVAVALREFLQEQVTMEEAMAESGWSITPARLRMW
jgi:hypothetical protein